MRLYNIHNWIFNNLYSSPNNESLNKYEYRKMGRAVYKAGTTRVIVKDTWA
jgi:hypothetical protein